jgi:diguanylate cyclase (GGDEF)-like protein/PAS domain S-box-containing protein
MTLEHSNSLTLEAMSILVAVFASFTALSLSSRITAAEPSARRWWIVAAAMALGGGIWAMHFVGMLSMSIPADYAVYLTLVSVVLPILVSGIGLHVVSRFPGSWAALGLGGLLVGSGVVVMHYTGMAAMEMPGVVVRYDWRLVVASIGIAIGAATAALWLAFRTHRLWQRLTAALIMGGAISGMHYTAMAGANFAMDHQAGSALNPSFPKAILALAVIGAVTFLLLLALILAFFDGKLATLTSNEADALERSEERHRLLIESASDIIGILDGSGRFTYESSSALRVLGYQTAEIVGRRLTDFVAPDSVEEAQRFLTGLLEQPGSSASVELWLVHRSGDRRAFELGATNLLHAPSIAGFVVNLRDITERTQLLARLETLSETDLLTDVLNRRGFNRLAEREFERARRAGEKLAVVMMDIDHFKQVNDRYGHAAGDLVLGKVAQVCSRGIRAGDLVGRTGGEEFTLLLAGGSVEAARDIVNRLRMQIAACTVSATRGDVSVTASFGIAHADPATVDLTDAVHRADEALYEAKKAGRDCVRIWE